MVKRTNKKNNSDSKKILVYFYMPNCLYCSKFNSLWEELKHTLKPNNKRILFRKIDGTKSKNKDFTETFCVKSYPTLILVDESKFKTFKKKRTLKDLIKFIK